MANITPSGDTNNRFQAVLAQHRVVTEPPSTDELPEELGNAQTAKRSPGETAAAFLRMFDPTGRHNLVRLDPNEKHKPLGRTFEPGEFEKTAVYVDEWDGKSNIYFSVHEPREHAPDARLAGYHIAKLRAVVADIDLLGANGDAELADLRSTIEDKLRGVGAPSPSYTLDSGGGLQLGWILPTKLDIYGEDIASVEDAGRGVAALIEGDAVSDRARIMRLPGPQNLPTANKQAKGRVARRASLLAQAERCDVETLTAAIPPIAGPAVAVDADATIAALQAEFETSPAFDVYFEKDWPAELAGRFTEALIADPALAALWAGKRPEKGDGTGSSYRAALAGRIGRLGWSAEDYVMLVRAWPFALQSGDFSEKLNERALARDWVRIALPVHPETVAEKLVAERGALAAKWSEPVEETATGSAVLLSDSTAAAVARLNETNAVVQVKGKTLVLVEQRDQRGQITIDYAESIVGNYVGAMMPQNYVTISNADQLVGKHNSHLQKALLIQVEEAVWAGDKAAEGALKHLITSDVRMVEPKFVDAFPVRDCARLLFTSNEPWIVPAGNDERRYAVFDVGDARRGDKQYFGAIMRELAAGGAGALLAHLQAFDLSTVDVRTAPTTEALGAQKKMTLGSAERWLMDRLTDERLDTYAGWPEEIGCTQIFKLYEKETEKARFPRPISPQHFGRIVQDLLKTGAPIRCRNKDAETGRERVYVLPPLGEARRAFEEWFGQPVHWDA